MSAAIPNDTWVLVSSTLGRIHRARKYGGADGYDISTPGKLYTNFAQDWYVKPAIVGENVCRKPRGQCYCGYAHVSATELAWLPVRGENAAPVERAA